MFGLLRNLFFFLVFCIVAAFIGRNYILAKGAGYVCRKTTSFPLTIETVDFSKFFPPVIYAYNLNFENPEDFEIANAMVISRMEARMPKNFWDKFDKPRIEELTLDISDLSIVRNSTGKVNVMVIDEIAKARPGQIHFYPIIGELDLSIAKVSYYDCYELTGGAKPEPVTIPVNIKNVRYKNIQNFRQIEQLVLREALKNAKFKGLEAEYKSLGIE